MSRPLRIEFAGALYHVTSRGIARDIIYHDDADRIAFVDSIVRAVRRYSLIVHAYCLMGNHYHLLVETPSANLSHALRHLNGLYARHYNRRYRRVGPVFQGRFKASLVERESYLLALCRYVVLNPVKAQLALHPRDWRWSSYRATAGLDACPPWLTVDWVLGFIHSGTRVEAQAAYRDFIERGMSEDANERLSDAFVERLIIGTEVFVAAMRERLKGSPPPPAIRREDRAQVRPPLADLFPHGLSLAERNRLIREAHIQHGYTQQAVAAHLGLHFAYVSRLIRMAEATEQNQSKEDHHGLGTV